MFQSGVPARFEHASRPSCRAGRITDQACYRVRMFARALTMKGPVAGDAADALAVALCHLQSERVLRVCV